MRRASISGTRKRVPFFYERQGRARWRKRASPATYTPSRRGWRRPRGNRAAAGGGDRAPWLPSRGAVPAGGAGPQVAGSLGPRAPPRRALQVANRCQGRGRWGGSQELLGLQVRLGARRRAAHAVQGAGCGHVDAREGKLPAGSCVALLRDAHGSRAVWQVSLRPLGRLSWHRSFWGASPLESCPRPCRAVRGVHRAAPHPPAGSRLLPTARLSWPGACDVLSCTPAPFTRGLRARNPTSCLCPPGPAACGVPPAGRLLLGH